MAKNSSRDKQTVRFKWFIELCEFELQNFSYECLKRNVDGTHDFVRSIWFFELQEFEFHEFYCISLKLPLRSSHSGMFSKSNYPKKDSSRYNFQYHTSELLVKFFEKCLRWSVIFYKFICTTILRLTAGVDEL